MYCPQCGAQTEQSTKFCKACGLKLADHARLLEEPREAEGTSEAQWLREKRLLAGVITTLASVFQLLIFLLIFGLGTLANLSNPAFHKNGLIMLLSFLFASLVTAGIGVGNLIASGFFRNMRERQLRIELGLLERKRKSLENETPKSQATLPHPNHEAEIAGITEHTTRELQPIPVTNRNISGE